MNTANDWGNFASFFKLKCFSIILFKTLKQLLNLIQISTTHIFIVLFNPLVTVIYNHI